LKLSPEEDDKDLYQADILGKAYVKKLLHNGLS